ncbi:MAG: hypothetical protein ACREIA_25600, partial [Opitutaceae bacterium]
MASFLVALDGRGSLLWVACGMLAACVLIALALVSFVPGRTRDRWKSRAWSRLLLADGFFLAFAIGALWALRLPTLSQLELNPDECGLILGARTLLHDPRFWLSFENTTLGPLSTFSLVPIGLLGFPIDFTTIKIAGLFIWSAVLALVFLGMRRLYPGMWARLFSLPVIVTIAAMSYWDYVAFNGEHMAVLMLACAFYLHASLLRDDRQVRPVRAMLLGVALALVPLAKIQPGPIAFVWGVFACVHSFIYCRRRVWFLCAGAGIPVCLLALYLGLSGAFHDFWESYILNNLLYASDGWNATQQNMTLWRNALQSPLYFLKIRDTRGLFFFCAFLLFCAAALAAGSPRFRGRLITTDVALGLSLTVAASVCVLMPKNNWTHYLLLLLVPVAMLIASVLAAFFDQAGERRLDIHIDLRGPDTSWTVRGNVFLAVVVAIFGVLAPASYAMMRGHPANRTARKNLEAGHTTRPVTAAILRHAKPGEPVAHWGVRFEDLTRAG